MRISILFLAFSAMATGLFSQNLQPVQWDFKTEKIADNEYKLHFIAQLEDHWKIYSQFLEGEDGPIPTSFYLTEQKGMELVGPISEQGNREEGYDALFDMKLVKFGGKVIFTQKVKIDGDISSINGYLEFMTCDDERCLPPKDVNFTFEL